MRFLEPVLASRGRSLESETEDRGDEEPEDVRLGDPLPNGAAHNARLAFKWLAETKAEPPEQRHATGGRLVVIFDWSLRVLLADPEPVVDGRRIVWDLSVRRARRSLVRSI